MARKKKQKQEKVEKKLQPGVTVHATQQLNSVAYQGKVTVKVMKGKECCSSAVYYNAGRWPLFYFISLCLMGQYSEADAFRPKYIDLYNYEGSEVPDISDATSSADMTNIFGHKVSTNTYPYMSLPEPKKVEASVGSSTLTYKFNIPFTQLQTSASGEGIEPINLVAMYANYNKLSQANPSAYFFVTDTDKKTLKNLLTSVSDIAYRNEYSLYIEWELCVSNPTKPTN